MVQANLRKSRAWATLPLSLPRRAYIYREDSFWHATDGRNCRGSGDTNHFYPVYCTGFRTKKHETRIYTITTLSIMSALFNFQSLLQVILLLICTCTYIHSTYPSILDNRKLGAFGIFWKCARVGERLSPYVALGCFIMALNNLSS